MTYFLNNARVRPWFAPPGFDFLTLTRASIGDAPQVTVYCDLGIDEGDELGIDEGEQIQTRDNARRRDKRRRQSANKKAQANAGLQAELPFADSVTAHTNPLPVESPPTSLVSKVAMFLQPLTRLKSSPSLSASTPAPYVQSQRNSKRREARKRKAEEEAPDSRPLKRTLAEVLSPGTSIEVEINTSNFDAARGAHTGKRGTKKERGSTPDIRRPYTVANLLSLGFRHIKWDGSTPFPLIDGVGRIIGIPAGQPGSGYAAELDDAFEEMMQEGEGAGLGATSSEGAGARGWFPAFNCGVSMGMGNSHPVQLDPKHMKDVLERLVGSKSVRRMAMYQNVAFSLWAPRVYEVYERTTNTMWEKMPGLQNNFPGGVFGAAAFNFGGSVWTFKHRDFQNWPFGWCAITALGKFDPTRSAQLILWELKLVIDFPHASTILIPSAVITHSNTPVADGDVQTSFTQYTAGAIFRWVENGCLTEEKLEKSDPTCYRQMMRDKSTAVSRRLELYSTVDELLCKID